MERELFVYVNVREKKEEREGCREWLVPVSLEEGRDRNAGRLRESPARRARYRRSHDIVHGEREQAREFVVGVESKDLEASLAMARSYADMREACGGSILRNRP